MIPKIRPDLSTSPAANLHIRSGLLMGPSETSAAERAEQEPCLQMGRFLFSVIHPRFLPCLPVGSQPCPWPTPNPYPALHPSRTDLLVPAPPSISDLYPVWPRIGAPFQYAFFLNTPKEKAAHPQRSKRGNQGLFMASFKLGIIGQP